MTFGPLPPPRRAYRPAEGRLVSGVSAGIAEHLGVDVLWIRLAFTGTAMINGVGVIAYLLLWRFLPIADEASTAPGLAAASRQGKRPERTSNWVDTTRAAAIVAVGAGVALAMQVSGRGIAWGLLIPLVIGGGGLALMWRGFDDAGRSAAERQGWRTRMRIASGLVLLIAAGAFAISAGAGSAALFDSAVAIAVALTGLALVIGPWIVSLVTDLSAERRERVRSQERADMAAHLHDSVLQTLSLLQKYADDPATVSTVARRQERELRNWLYGRDADAGESFAVALREAAAALEEDHQIAIELITVGDAPTDPDVAALVRAAREAMLNAAKHAGVPRIDVFAEVTDSQIDVFVRDRGAGFDPDAIDADRMGLRGSIIERMTRHGGYATVTSAPGSGTEVMLRLPRQHHDTAPTDHGGANSHEPA